MPKGPVVLSPSHLARMPKKTLKSWPAFSLLVLSYVLGSPIRPRMKAVDTLQWNSQQRSGGWTGADQTNSSGQILDTISPCFIWWEKLPFFAFAVYSISGCSHGKSLHPSRGEVVKPRDYQSRGQGVAVHSLTRWELEIEEGHGHLKKHITMFQYILTSIFIVQA